MSRGARRATILRIAESGVRRLRAGCLLCKQARLEIWTPKFHKKQAQRSFQTLLDLKVNGNNVISYTQFLKISSIVNVYSCQNIPTS